MARKGRFTQVSTAQKTMIKRNTSFGPFKDFTTNSSNSAGDMTLPYHDYDIDIPVVTDVVGVSVTDEQSPKKPPDPQLKC